MALARHRSYLLLTGMRLGEPAARCGFGAECLHIGACAMRHCRRRPWLWAYGAYSQAVSSCWSAMRSCGSLSCIKVQRLVNIVSVCSYQACLLLAALAMLSKMCHRAGNSCEHCKKRYVARNPSSLQAFSTICMTAKHTKPDEETRQDMFRCSWAAPCRLLRQSTITPFAVLAEGTGKPRSPHAARRLLARRRGMSAAVIKSLQSTAPLVHDMN